MTVSLCNFTEINHFKTSCDAEQYYQLFLVYNSLTRLKPLCWQGWRSMFTHATRFFTVKQLSCRILCEGSQNTASRITLDGLSIYCISCKNKSTASHLHPQCAIYPPINFSPARNDSVSVSTFQWANLTKAQCCKTGAQQHECRIFLHSNSTAFL